MHGILLHGENLDSLEIIVRAITAHLLETERDPFEHADCFTLRPSGKARLIKVGKTEDNNTMRKLVIDIAKSSNQGGRKVGIVIEADRMNAASANAFLKNPRRTSCGHDSFSIDDAPLRPARHYTKPLPQFSYPCYDRNHSASRLGIMGRGLPRMARLPPRRPK